MRKNSVTAFLLGFIPGIGHLYVRKFGRGLIYPFSILVTALFGFMMSFAVHDAVPFAIGLIIALLIWIVSIIDLVIALLRLNSPSGDGYVAAKLTGTSDEAFQDGSSGRGAAGQPSGASLALAFIPGLGHMHMGLLYRGITFLIGFFGILTMILFVTAITRQEQFLIFLGVLPIIWVYNLFDAFQMHQRIGRGETVEDRTIFEDFEAHRETGKKSKVLAMVLSFVPGAGHMYLGLQRRGLQLMAAFFLSIYILDVLRLSLFLFLIPMIWFFSFFDALQQVSRYEQGHAQDAPIVEGLMNHQRWIGIGLLALGAFYLFDQIGMQLIYSIFPGVNIQYWIDQYFQTTVISILFIAGGLKLLSGSKKKGGGGQ